MQGFFLLFPWSPKSIARIRSENTKRVKRLFDTVCEVFT